MPTIKDNSTPLLKIKSDINEEGTLIFSIIESSKGFEALNINLASLELNGNFKVLCFNGFNILVGSSYSDNIKFKDMILDCYLIRYSDDLLILQINNKDLDHKLKSNKELNNNLILEIEVLQQSISVLQDKLEHSLQKKQKESNNIFDTISNSLLVKTIATILAIILTTTSILYPNNEVDDPPSIDNKDN